MAYRWAAMLTSRGIETIHWAEIGPGNAPDHEIMDYAKSLVTIDTSKVRIHILPFPRSIQPPP
jgi:predicted nuclease of predicted toxin-antitoxin system